MSFDDDLHSLLVALPLFPASDDVSGGRGVQAWSKNVSLSTFSRTAHPGSLPCFKVYLYASSGDDHGSVPECIIDQVRTRLVSYLKRIDVEDESTLKKAHRASRDSKQSKDSVKTLRYDPGTEAKKKVATVADSERTDQADIPHLDDGGGLSGALVDPDIPAQVYVRRNVPLFEGSLKDVISQAGKFHASFVSLYHGDTDKMKKAESFKKTLDLCDDIESEAAEGALVAMINRMWETLAKACPDVPSASSRSSWMDLRDSFCDADEDSIFEL